jgi:hypothetical protein
VSLATEFSVAAHVWELGTSEEGWHEVKMKRPHPCIAPQPGCEAHRQQERRSLYLRKMKGLYFKCLSQNHKVASCRDPTKCWCCRRFGHTSTECIPSSSAQPSNLGDASTPPHIVRDDNALVDDNLLFGHSTTSTTYERMMDPMLLEARLMDQRRDTEGGSSTPLSTDSIPRVVNHHPSTKDIPTPMLLRSEAEQLIGHELINVLDDFKQLMVAPLPPHVQQFTSSVKKARMERLMDNRVSVPIRESKLNLVNQLSRWFMIY